MYREQSSSPAPGLSMYREDDGEGGAQGGYPASFVNVVRTTLANLAKNEVSIGAIAVLRRSRIPHV